jgi:hypothetical protein
MSGARWGADTTRVTAVEPQIRGRGAELLLDHCEALDTEHRRPTARERLERIVGDSLARLLIGALSSRRPHSSDLD